MYITVNVLKIQTLYLILFGPKFCFLMHFNEVFFFFVLKIISGMANSVDPERAV